MEHPQSTISSSSSSSSDAFPTSSDGGSSSSSSSSSSSRGLTDSLKHFPPSHAHPHSHSHHRRQPSPPPSTTSGSSQSSADDTPTHKKHEKKTPTKATGYPSSTTSSEDSSSSSSSTESNRRTLESIAHANEQHNPHTNVPPVNTKLANNNNTSNVSMLSPSSSPSHPLRLRGGYVDPEPASPSRTPPLDAAAPYKLPSSLKPASSSSSSSSVLPMAEIARQRSVSASSPTKLDKKAILKHKHRRASSDSSSSNGSNTSPLEHQSESPTSGSSESDTSPTMDHAASPSLPPAAAPAASTNFHHTKPIRSARHLHHQLHHHPHHHHPYHLHRPASATTAPSAASTSSSSMTPSPDAMFHHNTTIPTESSANAASIAARQHQSAFQQKRMQTQQNRLIHQQQAHPHPPHHPPSHPHHTQHHPQLHPHANRPAQPRNYPLPRPTGGSMNVAGPSSSADESLHLDDLSVYTDAPSVGSSDASSLYGQPQMALTHSTSGGGFPSTSSGMSGHTLMSEQMSSSDSDSITMQMNPSPSHCCEDECSHGRRPSRSDSEHTDWNRFVSPVPGDISTDEDLATTLYMDEQRTQLDRLAQHLQGTKLRSHKDRPPQHQPPPPHPHPAKTSAPSSNESMRTSDPESDGSSSQEILPNVSLPSSVD